MTLRILLCLAVASTALAADDKAASTNKATASPTLPQLLRTNAVGNHSFSPAWTGLCSVVMATGVFKQPEPPAFATNRYRVKFDTVMVTPKGSVINVGPRALARSEKDGGYSAMHTQRDELPGDVTIESAKTLADLGKRLGQPHGFPAAVRDGERVGWSFFAMNKDASLDTLQVNAVIEKRAQARDAHVLSLEIMRGKAAPEVKKPEKEKKDEKNDGKSEKKD